jgi:NAD(P)-dependent dehydrogenase (short-subunit alcohol dehydrogenase family)
MHGAAVITGSGSGIGRAVAMNLARAGYPVLVNDINTDAGEKVKAEVESCGGRAIFFKADVSDHSQVQAMFKCASDEFGPLEVTVNNAGVPGAFSLIGEMDEETWQKTIAVHLNGTMYCLRSAIKMMAENGYGRIINIASIAGLLGTVGSGEYAAAKSGMVALTQTAAKETGPLGITVNAIAPGLVATPTNLKLQGKGSPFIEAALAGTPTGRLTTPEEISELVLFLCSSAAGNISGEVIRIDGGAAINIGMDDFLRDFLFKKSQIIKTRSDGNKHSN